MHVTRLPEDFTNRDAAVWNFSSEDFRSVGEVFDRLDFNNFYRNPGRDERMDREIQIIMAWDKKCRDNQMYELPPSDRTIRYCRAELYEVQMCLLRDFEHLFGTRK